MTERDASSNPDVSGSLLDLSAQDYDSLYAQFSWQVPEHFNVAHAVCQRHADGSNRLAMIAETEGTADNGQWVSYSFDQIDILSDRLARLFLHKGIRRGDRVAVILQQRLETALVHLAAHKIGAISLPLSVLFGPEALQYRLRDSASRLVVTQAGSARTLRQSISKLPELEHVLIVAEPGPVEFDGELVMTSLEPVHSRSGESFWQSLLATDKLTKTLSTLAEDPAFLLYTSGTTGPPKGALIPHRALIGNLPGFECSQNGFPQADDRLFTPADWAWTGGLLDGLLPAWYYGVPVLALDCNKFNAERTVTLLKRHRITTGFFPPTALKMMRAVCSPEMLNGLSLRSLMSAGEAVGEELFNWGREALGIHINEMCGQTEHNYLMGNCSAIMPVKPGSMGKAYPGHRVAIMREDGTLCNANDAGEIVAHRNDPVHFLGYWRRPEATEAKYVGEWFRTGDVGYVDDDGYLWFLGRIDDVISSAGYRIGPGEIEDCVMRHPAVLQVAAIGVPDPDKLRGDVVKLCIVLREGELAGESLAREIQLRVRERLAAYEYPRIIEFLEALPMTTTGKVMRGELRRLHAEH